MIQCTKYAESITMKENHKIDLGYLRRCVFWSGKGCLEVQKTFVQFLFIATNTKFADKCSSVNEMCEDAVREQRHLGSKGIRVVSQTASFSFMIIPFLLHYFIVITVNMKCSPGDRKEKSCMGLQQPLEREKDASRYLPGFNQKFSQMTF